MKLVTNNLLFAMTAIAAGLVMGCAQGAAEDELLVPQDPLFAVGETVNHAFLAGTVELQEAPDFARLRVTGWVNGYAVVLNIDLDRNAIAAANGAPLPVDGETFFSAADSATFDKHPEQSSAVLRAWVFGACNTCMLGQAWQQVYGTVTITDYHTDAISGVLNLTLEGRIPAWAGADGTDLNVSINGPFTVGDAAAPSAAAPQPQTPTPETNTPPAPSQTPGPPAVVASPVYEAVLTAGKGIDFATGEIIHKASFATCDLWATAGHAFMKLSPGGTSPTQGRVLRWFQNSGGFVTTFDSLTDIPLELPTTADGSKSIVKARPFIGFVVQNNLSDGYTRVWIRDGDADSVTIEYQAVVAAN